MTEFASLPVAVIGAGPVGLAAASHLITRGLPVKVYEAGATVAAHVRKWAHVRLFSPWEYNTDPAARALLERHGWREPPGQAMPTGSELYDAYLKPLAETPPMAAVIETCAAVRAITRQGADKVLSRDRGTRPFVLEVSDGGGAIRRDLARAVIDASGTWSHPNPLGEGGIPAEGEAEHADRIAYGIPDVLGRDRETYAAKSVLVVGAGHSAANVLVDLAHLAKQDPRTLIVWATRGSSMMQVYGGGRADQLPARGELGSRLEALVDGGRLTLISGFGATRVRSAGGQGRRRRRDGGRRTRTRPVRPHRRRHGPAARPCAHPRAPARSRPVAGERESARPHDRPQSAFLRIGAAARTPRARLIRSRASTPSGSRATGGRRHS